MRYQARATICPFCGTPLGVTVEGYWVAMSLDEYRENAFTRDKELTAPLAPDRCIGCHSFLGSLTRDFASSLSPQTA